MKYLLGTISLVVLLQTLPVIQSARASEASTDVSSTTIEKVVQSNLMTNLSDGKFHPQKLISRAELAQILVKTFRLENRIATKQTDVTVADVPRNHWAYQDIQIVLKNDIMKGYRENMFFPNQRVTRAEALAIFAQAYGVFQFPNDTVSEILTPFPDAEQIPVWARKAIATVVTEGYVNTDDQGNLQPLRPMTRGDMAYLLNRYLELDIPPRPKETRIP
ncbi:MAG TPA: S-layer homology domain-containing protein [Nostocaceae cyanobacterium]|nr:S-layer homology domain-containing protein [Nostocaceae cyanobacterium]